MRLQDPKTFRKMRKLIGVTQHELAKLSGVDRTIIACYDEISKLIEMA